MIMEDKFDFERAREKLSGYLKWRDDVLKTSLYIDNMLANLNWNEKVCNEIPENRNSILANIEIPLNNIMSMDYASFTVSDASGTTAAFYSNSGNTRSIIQSYGSVHYHLINEYDEINKTELLIDQILEILVTFRSDLLEHRPDILLREAKEAYAKWKAGSVSNSDLAKDIRAFQDVFNGALHRARCTSNTNIPKIFPKPSWPKMAEVLAKKGPGFSKSLQYAQSTEDKLHLAFTEISKKTKEVNTLDMDRYFKDYIEHVFTVINLINEDLIK
jgi:hypothetical protein